MCIPGLNALHYRKWEILKCLIVCPWWGGPDVLLFVETWSLSKLALNSLRTLLPQSPSVEITGVSHRAGLTTGLAYSSQGLGIRFWLRTLQPCSSELLVCAAFIWLWCQGVVMVWGIIVLLSLPFIVEGLRKIKTISWNILRFFFYCMSMCNMSYVFYVYAWVPVYVYVHYVHVWCPWRLDDDMRLVHTLISSRGRSGQICVSLQSA